MGKEFSHNEVLELADALHSAAIRLLRRVRHVDQQSGLSPARLSALSVVMFAGPLKVGRLAAAEGVKSPTMTGIVNGLVEEGLVERRRAAGDLRSVDVAVTAKGRRLFNAARRRRVEAVAQLIDGLPDSDVVVLGQTSAVLRRILERG
jgi:DNA-binding MarR family transcriptional regulator